MLGWQHVTLYILSKGDSMGLVIDNSTPPPTWVGIRVGPGTSKDSALIGIARALIDMGQHPWQPWSPENPFYKFICPHRAESVFETPESFPNESRPSGCGQAGCYVVFYDQPGTIIGMPMPGGRPPMPPPNGPMG